MASAEGYVMVRHPRCMPFVMGMKEWELVHWKARKGYQAVDENGEHGGHNECVWFSPHCLSPQGNLFYGASDAL